MDPRKCLVLSGYVRLCPLNLGEMRISIHRHMSLLGGKTAMRALLVLGLTLLALGLGAALLPPLGSDSNPYGDTAGGGGSTDSGPRK